MAATEIIEITQNGSTVVEVIEVGPAGPVGPQGPAGTTPVASTTIPANLGTAAVGTGTTFARADHVHAKPSATDIGATTVGNAVFIAANAAAGRTAVELGAANSVTFTDLTLTGALTIASPSVPAAINSTGVAGRIAFTNNFLYICVATNTWRRVQLGTWD